MNEADILLQLSELYDRWWVILQWWVSVSFALLAISHFAADKLNVVLLAAVLVLYIAFTLWMRSLLDYNSEIMAAFRIDLGEMNAAGDALSKGGNAFVVGYVGLERFFPAANIAKYGTFASVIIYLIYSWIQNRKKSSE